MLSAFRHRPAAFRRGHAGPAPQPPQGRGDSKMKLTRIALAVTTAALFMTANLALACPGHENGATAQTTSGGTAVKVAGAGGCTKNASGCSKAQAAGCCAKAKQAVMASVGDATDVTACTFKVGQVAFKGTVVCNHCNLKKSETCQTMFKTESGCVFAVAGDQADALKEAAGGGKALVRVKGSVGEDGKLAVTTFRVVKTLDTVAAF